MKIKYLLVVFIALGISSCRWGGFQKQLKDTISYHYKTLKEFVTNCDSKLDSNCVAETFSYPIFKDQKMLNYSIIRKLTFLITFGDTSDSTLKKTTKIFLIDFKDFKQNPKYSVYYRSNIYTKILRQDSSLITLQIICKSHANGEQIANYNNFINWNTKADKSIVLNDILINGYQEKLRQLAEKIFRKEEKLGDTVMLPFPKYMLKGGHFSLNDNFSITPKGIRFFYNEYEIKQSSTDIFIPYKQIKSLLRRNTVVTQYIK